MIGESFDPAQLFPPHLSKIHRLPWRSLSIAVMPPQGRSAGALPHPSTTRYGLDWARARTPKTEAIATSAAITANFVARCCSMTASSSIIPILAIRRVAYHHIRRQPARELATRLPFTEPFCPCDLARALTRTNPRVTAVERSSPKIDDDVTVAMRRESAR